MAQSRRFKKLKSQIYLLRKDLLPKLFNPTGTYPKKIQTQTYAFVVLTHAEIEAFFEDRVNQVSLDAIKKFKKNGYISTILSSLLAFSGISFEKPPESISPINSKPKDWDEKLFLEKKLEKALKDFLSSIKQNHGVKQKNLLKLLLPIGISPLDIDPQWLIDMDSFGFQRGIFAHSSGNEYRTTQVPDPKDELEKVERLLIEIGKIDLLISKLR